MFQGAVIKAKMVELYTTVSTIEKAEEVYYYEHGEYATGLDYSFYSSGIENFKTILGVDIPGEDSVFLYGVFVDPLAGIYVGVRKRGYGDVLCHKKIEGPNKGEWRPNISHPWAKYLSVP